MGDRDHRVIDIFDRHIFDHGEAMRGPIRILALAVLLAGSGCATLGQAIVAPRFEIAEQPSEFRLVGPSLSRPLGGATVRLFARVENPNPIGLRLTRLVGTLSLEGLDAADADLPLGLALAANGTSTIPIDIAVSFANLPRLADVLSRAVSTGEVDYRLRGTITVDAGSFGEPSFGPMTLLEGTADAFR